MWGQCLPQGDRGYALGMSADKNVPNHDDVMAPTETAIPDHHEHAKTPKRLDDEDLDQRARHEEHLVHDESSSTDPSDR